MLPDATAQVSASHGISSSRCPTLSGPSATLRAHQRRVERRGHPLVVLAWLLSLSLCWSMVGAASQAWGQVAPSEPGAQPAPAEEPTAPAPTEEQSLEQAQPQPPPGPQAPTQYPPAFQQFQQSSPS